ncbi:MAG: AraC family transcriptional regulator [Propionibacteriaceae bacterium]|nr:AraC family transcriptional regulator [Propionibacteriaceae bacterium]
MPRARVAPADPSRRHFIVEPGVPFCAHSLAVRRALLPAAYDWGEYIVIRQGTGRVTHRDNAQAEWVKPGSVVVLMPDAPCGIQPEGLLKATSVFVSEDYLRAHVQFGAAPWAIADLAPHTLVEWCCPKPSQVVSVDPTCRDAVFAAVDELSDLTKRRGLRASYHHATHLLFTLLQAVMPQLESRLNSEPCGPQDVSHRASLASTRVLQPMEGPVQATRQTLREHYREPLGLDELATAVHVSARQLSRLFTDAMGKTPLAYRDSLRVQHMVLLLVNTRRPVRVITQDLGWSNPGQAARVFRDAVGMTPTAYRAWLQPRLADLNTDLDMLDTDLDIFEQ